MADVITINSITIFVATDGTTRFVCPCPKTPGHLLCKAHATEVGKRMMELLNEGGVIKP